MTKDLPPSIVQKFAEKQPDVWNSYNQLSDAVSQSGPIETKTQRLLKLAIAIGIGREGAVRAHTRRGLRAEVSSEEMLQTALLAITTIGWSGAFAAHCWIEEEIKRFKK